MGVKKNLSRASASEPRRPGRPVRVSRTQILEAALDVMRRDGREAVTMRSVAAALGAAPMSLYTHVRDNEDLLEGVAALCLDRIEVGSQSCGTWLERLAAWMHLLRRQLLLHPEVLQFLARQHYGSPQVLRVVRVAVRILREAGFPARAAAEAAQGVLWTVFRFFLLESGERQNPTGKPSEEQLAATLAEMTAAERAEMQPLVRHLFTSHFDAFYEATVQRTLAGLASECAPRRAGKAP